MRLGTRKWVALLAGTWTLFWAGSCAASGILVQSYPTMASFLSSSFYDYVVNQLVDGPSANCGSSVDSLQQGSQAVPANSAGGPSNSEITPEVSDAVIGPPTVFLGSPDSSTYTKEYVSLGNATTGENIPGIAITLPAVTTTSTSGYLGQYDLAIVELGENLAPGTGLKNSERSRFDVEWSLDGTRVTVGGITNTSGNFINIILLDLNGIAGIPSHVDRVHIVDASGQNPPVKGSLDIDGVLRLTPEQPTPIASATWGKLKSFYR